jgi:hypothetical protein
MRIAPILAAVLATAAYARTAEACGGFFCQNQPMNQAGEQIAFFVGEDHVQAHIQIQYQGEAARFAWVVPVHGVPTLSVGSEELFRFVGPRTQPTFTLEWDGGGQCGAFYPPMMADSGTAAGGGQEGVTVLSQGAVGHYESAVLSATSSDALSTWLRTNQYDLSDEGLAALAPYVTEGGYTFVALRLQQSKGTGDLHPIVLDFAGDVPCIPIRLTAIAANDDMPITAYVFSSARAVPTNYRHVLINEARIDWLSGGANYREVASLAVDEAGGRAFLTEVAGSKASIFGSDKLDDGRLDVALLRTKTTVGDFLRELGRQQFPRDLLLEMLKRYVPLPASLRAEGVTEQQFYNVLVAQFDQPERTRFLDAIATEPGRAPFAADAFATELDANVVQPIKAAQRSMDGQTYVTRLFTTMSPAEMTVDPDFAFNSSLSDVPRDHRARLTCNGGDTSSATLTLADGRSFAITGGWNGGPIAAAVAGPAAARIEQLASMGPPSVIVDNTQETPVDPAACGCGVTDAGGLMALAMLLRRRRAA